VKRSGRLRSLSSKRSAAGVTNTFNPSPGPTRRAWINRTVKQGAKRKNPLAKIGKQKAKRQARNAGYYKSAEWRAKRTAVFERDGYQCREIIYNVPHVGAPSFRCPNRGEIVNGKQTARGLVAEETGYMHRGIPDAIDRIKTRCRGCDRRLTPLERVNHANGFRQAHVQTRTRE